MTVPRPQKTLWLWPSGMFPRRVVYYLKAKSLPLSILRSPSNPRGDLSIISLTLDQKAMAIVPSKQGTEDRPPGCSLPVIRVDGTRTLLVRQSATVLEYLEDCYPPADGYRDLTGGSTSMETRATVRDMVQAMNEVAIGMSLHVRHSYESTLSWSGMTKEQQSSATGEEGRAQWTTQLAKLDSWAREDVVDRGALSIAGVTDMPTLADFALISSVQYVQEVYGFDMLEGFEVLGIWYERFTASQWFVSRSEISLLESEGLDALFGSKEEVPTG
ncbi:hypothetical protein ACHAQH_003221 [Verticillium albo-atrum]